MCMLDCRTRSSFTVSSSAEGCEELVKRCSTDANVVQLAVSGAFHSSYMLPAVPMLQDALDQVDWRMEGPEVLVVSNVTAQFHESDSEAIKAKLLAQLTEPVLWYGSMQLLLGSITEDDSKGAVTSSMKLRKHQWWELGAGRILTGIAKRIHRRIKIGHVAA